MLFPVAAAFFLFKQLIDSLGLKSTACPDQIRPNSQSILTSGVRIDSICLFLRDEYNLSIGLIPSAPDAPKRASKMGNEQVFISKQEGDSGETDRELRRRSVAVTLGETRVPTSPFTQIANPNLA